MSAAQSSRKKNGRLYIRVSEGMISRYKEVLASEERTMSEDIENYIRWKTGEDTEMISAEAFKKLAIKVKQIEKELKALKKLNNAG